MSNRIAMQMSKNSSSANIAYVSVGVADMAVVRQLWVEQLGLEVLETRQGPDAELGKLWNLSADQFVEQLLLCTPGATTGWLHFVQFREPAAAVRSGAAATDLGAKNLDVNCTGMPDLVAGLITAGYQPRSAIGEYEIDGIQVREVQIPVHDDLNLVLIEVLSAGFEVELSPQGYAALTSFVVIVPDVTAETDFYLQLFGMERILSHELSGPEIEMAAGLPAGTVLNLKLLGAPDNLFGRMELIEYMGVQGDNRFSRAVPPATGILRCGFRVASLADFAIRAESLDVQISHPVEVATIHGSGRVVELASPGGLRLEIVEYMGSESKL
jgi:catechol 2,3-dioxygenase-like lactoylglutathione lyase family enzyme